MGASTHRVWLVTTGAIVLMLGVALSARADEIRLSSGHLSLDEEECDCSDPSVEVQFSFVGPRLNTIGTSLVDLSMADLPSKSQLAAGTQVSLSLDMNVIGGFLWVGNERADVTGQLSFVSPASNVICPAASFTCTTTTPFRFHGRLFGTGEDTGRPVALGLNGTGTVTADLCCNYTSTERGYLLLPVDFVFSDFSTTPEPGALLLLTSGVVAVGFRRRGRVAIGVIRKNN
jgi:hypothetical protein